MSDLHHPGKQGEWDTTKLFSLETHFQFLLQLLQYF